MKRLNHPNLIPIFIGIALGCILGSLPFAFPGIPQPVKLGLAGGPLIVSILISRFGPKYSRGCLPVLHRLHGAEPV